MTLQGDLSTLDLAALLQNLEMHERTGQLVVERDGQSTSLYFKDGKLTLFAVEDRPSLVDTLVDCGAISTDQLEAARELRRGSRKSLIEVLVTGGMIEQAAVNAIAQARLVGDACELLAANAGAFTFSEGGIPRGVFDAEERKLGLALASGPLLLEAARRSDHWQMIRATIPTDSTHYVLQQEPPLDGAPEWVASLVQRLDGSRSVAEVLCAVPHQRFEGYQTLARWIEAQHVRPASADDIAGTVDALAADAPERAWTVLLRARAKFPEHVGLLAAQARLGEDTEQVERAVEALKLLAHQARENGEPEQALETLARALVLAPDDPSLVESQFELAGDVGDEEAVATAGRALVALYRGRGLHAKAKDVLQRCRALAPDDWELICDWTQSLVDCGEVEAALSELDARGKRALAAEQYDEARAAYEHLLVLAPGNELARKRLERIDAGIYARNRARRRALVRRGSLIMTSVLIIVWSFFEIAARHAAIEASRTVSRLGLIESKNYTSAIDVYRAVVHEYPHTTVAVFELAERLEDLEAKLEGQSAASRSRATRDD